MQNTFRKLTLCLVLAAVGAFGQTKPSFEVATIKPAAPLDQAKLVAAMQAGGKLPYGANVDAHRAEYTYLDLKTLVSLAYGVKLYQVSGPDWMATTRFDIIAIMPEGASKDDAPKMLRSLLADRFQLTTHLSSAEHPVLALVVGKGGPKMKASEQAPVAIDETVPLKPGELTTQGPDGPIRMTVNAATGSAVVDMGLKGKMSYKMNAGAKSMQMDFSMTTMGGFADMLTQIFSQLGGGSGRQVVDMTGIKGNYEASLEVSLADLLNMARSAGMDIPGGGPAGGDPGNSGVGVAADPSGGAASMTEAVQSLGLRLESRKAVVEQLIVDHVEKAPTEN